MRTKIEWVRNQDGSQGHTINPVKGLCPMACSYCYARRMYKRFRWNPEIRFDASVFDGLYKLKPSRIFVGSTMELFGDWIRPGWSDVIFRAVKENAQHTFIFLTKKPENLIKWSSFPDNCWVGVSATDHVSFFMALFRLKEVKAKIRFISLEPYLQQIKYPVPDLIQNGIIDWLIIGQQTPSSPKTQPKIEWIQEIVQAADQAKVPVFLKNNLELVLPRLGSNLFNSNDCLGVTEYTLRQEFPK